MFGLMEGNMKAIGLTIRCMEKDATSGETEENTKANIKMIRSMGQGAILGQMAVNFLVNGSTASVTAEAKS